MKAIRDWSQYACHDLRIVSRKPDDTLIYLATRRLEPHYLSNLSKEGMSIVNEGRLQHSAPINGCWWPPGGRIAIPKPGSILEREGFDVIDSILLKLNREIGVAPADISKINLLGVGETNFNHEMAYTYRGSDSQGKSYEFELPIRMSAPQRTINKNYVVEVSSEAMLKMDHLCSACWIDVNDYRQHRNQFCDYEQRFMDALFGCAQ
jgi:hypothetical protein